MKLIFFAFSSTLTWVHFAHCQDWKDNLVDSVELLRTTTLEGIEDIKQKQNDAMVKLQGYEDKLQEYKELLQKIPGTVNNNQDALQRQQEQVSSLRQEISGVISLLETEGIDECSEGSHNCGDYASCKDRLFRYECSCLPGFARDGSSRCEDIDECAQGKADCSAYATCRNFAGSYSCSCKPPFEGDGRTCGIDECSAQEKAECSPHATCKRTAWYISCFCNQPFEGDGYTCDFSCRRPAKRIEGLGCVKLVEEPMTWEQMNTACHEAGWRLLQDATHQSLFDVSFAFSIWGWEWIGVYGGKWLESRVPVQEELWEEGSRSDPSRRCGFIIWDNSSFSMEVSQRGCSSKARGYCQLLL